MPKQYHGTQQQLDLGSLTAKTSFIGDAVNRAIHIDQRERARVRKEEAKGIKIEAKQYQNDLLGEEHWLPYARLS